MPMAMPMVIVMVNDSESATGSPGFRPTNRRIIHVEVHHHRHYLPFVV